MFKFKKLILINKDTIISDKDITITIDNRSYIIPSTLVDKFIEYISNM